LLWLEYFKKWKSKTIKFVPVLGSSRVSSLLQPCKCSCYHKPSQKAHKPKQPVIQQEI
jgi:hypothetical protein